MDNDGHARGRPVALALNKAGALMIGDDVGDTVCRVAADDADRTLRPAPPGTG